MTTKLTIFGYHVTPPYRHLQEHLDEVADGAKIETEDDVYFGYFNVHDTDKDGAFLFPSKTNRLVLVQDISTIQIFPTKTIDHCCRFSGRPGIAELIWRSPCQEGGRELH